MADAAQPKGWTASLLLLRMVDELISFYLYYWAKSTAT